MTYPFSFKATGYIDGDNTYYEQCGMGLCTGYADAAKQIEEMFADELIAIKHLEIFEEHTVIPMPQKVVDEIVNEYFYGSKTYEVEITQEEARSI